VTASAPTDRRPGDKRNWRGFACALVLALVPTSDAVAQVTYSGSLRTASGTYFFTERTTSVYVLSGIEVAWRRVRLSGTVPVIYQSTPWTTYLVVPLPTGGRQSGQVATQLGQRVDGSGRGRGSASGAGTPGSTSDPGASTSAVVTLPTESVTGQTGMGDLIARAGFLLTESSSPTAIQVHAAYKPGLASAEEGFGTGALDWGGGISMTHLLGRHQISAAIEAWRLGDMPDLPLNNAVSYRVAYDTYLQLNRWSLSGAFSGWTSIMDGAVPPRDISIGVARHFGLARRSLGATASFGLTESSPDVAVALDWRVRL
jgi:hypothetical protein